MRFTLPSAAVVSEDKRSYLAQEDGIFLVSSLLRLDGVCVTASLTRQSRMICRALPSWQQCALS